jgi:hypothetical protein
LWVYTKKGNIAKSFYQKIVDKVNEELGSDFFILENKKEEVYNNIKDMTPEEVEEMLKYEYKTFTFNSTCRHSSNADNKKESAKYGSLESQSKDEDYIKESAKGKRTEPGYIPNAKSDINLLPLK